MGNHPGLPGAVPVAFERVSWAALGTSLRYRVAMARMAIVGASRNEIFHHLPNRDSWRCLGGSVETTQSVCDNGSKAYNGGSSPRRQDQSELRAPPGVAIPALRYAPPRNMMGARLTATVDLRTLSELTAFRVRRGEPMRPFPITMEDWIAEIRAALEDAAEAIPFGPLVWVEIKPEDLFHWLRLSP